MAQTPPPNFIPDEEFQSDEDQYGGLGGEAKAFTAGLASGPSFGLSDQAAVHSGMINPETLKGLKEQNPIASIAGELTGIVGASAAGDFAGLANLPATALKIGRLIEGGTAAVLPLKGGRLAASIAKVAGFAAEGGLYGLGQSISEDALGDSSLLSEKTISNIGWSAAMAGGLGGILGAYAGRGIDASSGEAKLGIEAAVKGIDPLSPEGAYLATEAPAAEKQTFLDALQARKKNANEIEDAAEELGVKAHPGQLSGNKTVQDTYTALAETPTIPGVVFQNAIKKDFDGVQRVIRDSLGSYEPTGTPYEAGAAIKTGIQDRLDKIYQPIKDQFEKRAALGDQLPLSEDTRLKVYEEMVDKAKTYGSVGSKGSQIIKGYAERGLVQNTGRQMDQLISEVGQAQRSAFVSQDYEAANALGVVKNHFQESLDEQITKKLSQESPEAVAEFSKTKKEYKSLKDTMRDLVGDQRIAGAKRNVTMGSLDEALAKLPNEQVIDKFFNAKNYDGLVRLKKNFPDVFDMLIRHKKDQIMEGAMHDGQVAINKVLPQIFDQKKISSEVRELLFDKPTLKKLEAAKTWMEAWPKHFNPSGTSYGIVLREGMSHLPTAVLNNVTSFLTKRALDSYAAKGEAGRLMALGNAQKEAVKAQKAMQSQVKGIINGARALAVSAPSRLLTSGNYEKKTDEIRKNAMNDGAFMDHLVNTTSAFSDHIPKMTQSIQMALTRTNEFLNSKLPPPANTSLFGVVKNPPSDADISKFNRYYSIAENPYHALTQVKDGTIMPETVETLSTVYPKLYEEMKKELMTGLMSSKDAMKIPYQIKQSIHEFLGAPMDNPMSILSNQAVFAVSPQPGQMAQGKPRAKGLDKMDRTGRMTADYGAMSDKV